MAPYGNPKQKKTSFFWLLALIPVFYLAACSFNSHKGNSALSELKNGDSEARVLALFGPPTTREKPGVGYIRYVNDKCSDPCAERLWFENRMSLADEAWVITLDSKRTVIKSAHLVSP